MLVLFARLMLMLMGWKITSVIPPDTKKCVIAVAPHTSYWDFVIGRLAYWVLGVKASFLIKKEVFRFPFKRLLLHMGGLPVDRGRSSRMVDQVVEQFKISESLFIVITPEGTRKPVKQWKKGFYYIASQAKVPIALGYLDYAKKEGGVGKVIIPNGDIEGQMKEIKEFYRGMIPRYPEKFYLED
jgi:1-acyl-sn-glycerol-3-phosphate acyltransferase